MAEVTLTLKGDAASRLQRLLKDAAYPSAEAAVADALEALEENRQRFLYSHCFICSSNQLNPFLERMERSEAILAATLALLGLADSLDKWTTATVYFFPS